MLFPTMEYSIFLIVLLFAAWLFFTQNLQRKLLLLGASWLFYAWWDPRFVALLIISSIANWWLAIVISDRHDAGDYVAKRKYLVLGVVANLATLGFFKYFGFFTEQFLEVLNAFGVGRDIKIFEIILPVAVSFFTFQGISYVVDVYRGTCKVYRDATDILLLTSFFPHLVAGPIVRAADLIPQFQKVPTPTRDFFAWGALLIIWGLFKKTVIASTLAEQLVDKAFFDPTAFDTATLWVAAIGYSVQIYCDFSAYSDMAIGSAALLGYHFHRNFDQPYRATSLQDFWRRWHISLSSWLKDYLYIPLGGSRGGTLLTCRNLMITMVLGGFWHGASWTFFVWGAIHGMVLCFERAWGEMKPLGSISVPTPLAWAITFLIVTLAWIPFHAADFNIAWQFLTGLSPFNAQQVAVNNEQGGGVSVTAVGCIIIGIGMNFLPPRCVEQVAKSLVRLPTPLVAFGLSSLFVFIDAIRPEGIAPFIYFKF